MSAYRHHAPSVRMPGASELSLDKKKEVEEAFQLFDMDNNGELDFREVMISMKALGFEPSQDEVAKLFKSVGKTNDKTINRDDYMKLMTTEIKKQDPEEEMRKAFRLFDPDGKNKITFESLKAVAQDLEEHITDAELQEMITEADRDGDGSVSFQEFARIMRKTYMD